MIPCYKFKRLITDYLDAQIAPDDKEWFLEHQSRCPACYRLLNRTQKIVQYLKSLPPVETEQNFIEQLRRQIIPDIQQSKNKNLNAL